MIDNGLTRKRRPRQGIALILVLIVIALLALAAYAFSDLMLAEYEGTLLSGRQVQAQAMVDSAIEATKIYLEQDEETRTSTYGGHYDNPEFFQARLVVDHPNEKRQGRWTVLSPALDELGYPAGMRYGLEDESGRLNLNLILLADEQVENGARELLMNLPAMTEFIADSILDFIDSDIEPREFGLEDYSQIGIDPPNGPLQTIEQLLMVPGMTPSLLFGLDRNRNGFIDANEAGGVLEAGIEDGTMDGGWASYFTLYSMERNTNSLGEPRIDINNEDLELLQEEMDLAGIDQEWASFIIAYRQNGPSNSNNSGVSMPSRSLDLTKEGRVQLQQVLDLVGAKSNVNTFDDDNGSVLVASPFSDNPGAMTGYLSELMDNFTVNSQETIPGRININTASRAVLLGVPGMTQEIADSILAQRDPTGLNDPTQTHEAWILERGLVTLEEMRALQPYICAGGDVFRAQIVGYFSGEATSSRAEVIIDATKSVPTLLSWKDMTHLGRGFAIETLGVEVTE